MGIEPFSLNHDYGRKDNNTPSTRQNCKLEGHVTCWSMGLSNFFWRDGEEPSLWIVWTQRVPPLKNGAWKTSSFPFGFRPIFRGEVLNFGRLVSILPSNCKWKDMFQRCNFCHIAPAKISKWNHVLGTSPILPDPASCWPHIRKNPKPCECQPLKMKKELQQNLFSSGFGGGQ